jgi:hypothetical protein
MLAHQIAPDEVARNLEGRAIEEVGGERRHVAVGGS